MAAASASENHEAVRSLARGGHPCLYLLPPSHGGSPRVRWGRARGGGSRRGWGVGTRPAGGRWHDRGSMTAPGVHRPRRGAFPPATTRRSGTPHERQKARRSPRSYGPRRPARRQRAAPAQADTHSCRWATRTAASGGEGTPPGGPRGRRRRRRRGHPLPPPPLPLPLMPLPSATGWGGTHRQRRGGGGGRVLTSPACHGAAVETLGQGGKLRARRNSYRADGGLQCPPPRARAPPPAAHQPHP